MANLKVLFLKVLLAVIISLILENSDVVAILTN